MISIIIPVYNQAKKLKLCLESIKRQTLENYEIIIVNDGSKDNSANIAFIYKEQFGYRLEIINQENKGANAARNAGARLAKGEFLLFCDADLILEPTMLKQMHETLQNNSSASYVYSSFKYGAKVFSLWPFDAEKLKEMPYIHTTSLMKKEHFPGFDENIKRLQDWDLWLTMLEKGHNGVWINQILFTVQTGGTMSQWLPRASYKIFPWLPGVKKYNQAVAIIRQKHHL